MPVIDTVAEDYLDDFDFVAIAWKSDLDAATEMAHRLFSENLQWGIGDDIFRLYGIPGQPASVIVSQGVVVDAWFGAAGDEELRTRLDAALALSS
ncbi:MAG: hypothetical protein O3B42_05910 [Actinomycetota bacterium]|nr:hypothetical protein [Actinomycetota bacterium]